MIHLLPVFLIEWAAREWTRSGMRRQRDGSGLVRHARKAVVRSNEPPPVESSPGWTAFKRRATPSSEQTTGRQRGHYSGVRGVPRDLSYDDSNFTARLTFRAKLFSEFPLNSSL
jgi:hypothetical protein